MTVLSYNNWPKYRTLHVFINLGGGPDRKVAEITIHS